MTLPERDVPRKYAVGRVVVEKPPSKVGEEVGNDVGRDVG
jgi:hypothetical protein